MFLQIPDPNQRYPVIGKIHQRFPSLFSLKSVSQRQHAAALVDTKRERYVGPLFDFISAPPSAGLTEVVASRQQQVMDLLAGIVDEGKAEGSISESCDSELVAWMLVSVFWAEDICILIGLPGFLLEGRSKAITEGLFRCFITGSHT